MYNQISIICNDEKVLFATHPKSIEKVNDLINVFTVLDKKFPEEDGYSILVKYSILTFNRDGFKTIIGIKNKIIDAKDKIIAFIID